MLGPYEASFFGSQKSWDVGCYVGLRPKRSQSGQSDPQLRITKEGDIYLRKMLVQGAQLILQRRSPDTDLKRWGLRLVERGGKSAKKRVVVAVARKLGILLHRLWVTGKRTNRYGMQPPGSPRKRRPEASVETIAGFG